MKAHRIIDYITVLGLLICFIFPAVFYTQLPDQIPIHFNALGRVDDYSNKTSIWLIPVVSLILYLGIFFIEKHLQTKSRESQEYTTVITQHVLKVLNLIITLAFTYISVQVTLIALGESGGLGSWFLAVLVISLNFIPLLILAKKKKIFAGK